MRASRNLPRASFEREHLLKATAKTRKRGMTTAYVSSLQKSLDFCIASRPIAAVLEDAAAELDGGPLRLLVLGYLPDEDTYAFTTTSKTFLASVEQHDEICKNPRARRRAR